LIKVLTTKQYEESEIQIKVACSSYALCTGNLLYEEEKVLELERSEDICRQALVVKVSLFQPIDDAL
jgi:hypothetical protein